MKLLAVASAALAALAAAPLAVSAGKGKKCTGHFGSSGVANLSEAHFPDKGSDKVWFIKFYAPWCGHCKAMIPAMKQLGKAFKRDDVIGIGGVDCTDPSNQGLCGRMGVQGYPTIKVISGGKPKAYNGARDFQPIKQYLDGLKAKRGSKGGSAKCPKGLYKSTIKDSVVPLCEKHFPDPKKGGKNSWVIAFYNSKDSGSAFPESDQFNRLALEFGNEPQDKAKGSKKNLKQKKRVEEINEKYGIAKKIADGEFEQKRKGSGTLDPLAKFGAVCCDCDKKAEAWCASQNIPGVKDGKLPEGSPAKGHFLVYNAAGKRVSEWEGKVGSDFDEDGFATFVFEKLGYIAAKEGGKKEAQKEEL